MCFRNGERGATHHPEFTMLEWYRAGASYRDLMADCEALLRAVLAAAASRNFPGAAERADPASGRGSISRRRRVPAVLRHRSAGDLPRAGQSEPRCCWPTPHARSASRRTTATHWEDLFFRIFLDKIEPNLGIGAPTILYDYPIAMAALARAKPDDPRLAERFELYVCGLELANAFGELTDAAEQRAPLRRRPGEKQRALWRGLSGRRGFPGGARARLPASAGIALGFDRLVMLAAGAEHRRRAVGAGRVMYAMRVDVRPAPL